MPAIKPNHYFILLALGGGDAHGLEIARQVEDLSGGAVRLWPVSLYGSLESLGQRGWIEELVDPEERPTDESNKRRIYRLTEEGRAAANAETERLARIVRLARPRLLEGKK